MGSGFGKLIQNQCTVETSRKSTPYPAHHTPTDTKPPLTAPSLSPETTSPSPPPAAAGGPRRPVAFGMQGVFDGGLVIDPARSHPQTLHPPPPETPGKPQPSTNQPPKPIKTHHACACSTLQVANTARSADLEDSVKKSTSRSTDSGRTLLCVYKRGVEVGGGSGQKFAGGTGLN
jgi:hypothetical protein